MIFPRRCWPTIVFGKTVPWISGWLPQRRRSIMGSGELQTETTVLFLHLSDFFRMVKSSSSSSRHQWCDAARLGDQVGPEKVAALRQVQRSGVRHPHRKQRRLLRQVRDERTLLLFSHPFTFDLSARFSHSWAVVLNLCTKGSLRYFFIYMISATFATSGIGNSFF